MATPDKTATIATMAAFMGAAYTALPSIREFRTTATPTTKQRRSTDQRSKRKQQKESRRRNRG